MGMGLKEDRSNFNVLFCTPFLNFPPKGGPELRSFNSIKALSAVSDVQVAQILQWRQKSPEMLQKELQKIGVKKILEIVLPRHQVFISSNFQGLNRQLIRVLNFIFRSITFYPFRKYRTISREIRKHHLDIPDATIWISFANLFIPVITRLRKESKSQRIVADTDSVWSTFILRGVPYKPRILSFITFVLGHVKRFEEKKMLHHSTITTAVSEVDQKAYSMMYKKPEKVFCAYNVIDFNEYESKISGKKDETSQVVLLTGSFGQKYSPMDHGARWFVENVWPIVKSRNQNALLYLVGKGSETFWKTVPADGIFVFGKVDSIIPFMHQAAVNIVPLWYESGTRFKILEAAAMSTPVVTTTLGAEGLNVKNCFDLVEADNSEDFAQGVLNFLNHKKVISDGESLQAVIRERYSLETLEKQVLRILQALNFEKKPEEF